MAEYERVYRHGPIGRLVHFIHLVAMIMVILSGFQILYPSAFKVFGTLGTARKLHFYGMYLIVFPALFRFIYHVWVSKDIKKFIITGRDISYIPAFLKYYLFMGHDKPWTKNHEYNPGQKMTYAVWPFLLIFQAASGFAIYWANGDYPSWVINTPLLGGFATWMVNGMLSGVGGVLALKFWHTIIAWVFVVTVAIHLYLGTTGVTLTDAYMSMVTGYERFKKEA